MMAHGKLPISPLTGTIEIEWSSYRITDTGVCIANCTILLLVIIGFVSRRLTTQQALWS